MYIIKSNMCTIFNPLQPSNFNEQADVINIRDSKSTRWSKDLTYTDYLTT